MIEPLGINWFSFASMDIARDDALLERAARSGCRQLFIGFESLIDENLALSGKQLNRPNRYAEAIEKIHRQGIAIMASFIFGLDEDRPPVLLRPRS